MDSLSKAAVIAISFSLSLGVYPFFGLGNLQTLLFLVLFVMYTWLVSTASPYSLVEDWNIINCLLVPIIQSPALSLSEFQPLVTLMLIAAFQLWGLPSGALVDDSQPQSQEWWKGEGTHREWDTHIRRTWTWTTLDSCRIVFILSPFTVDTYPVEATQEEKGLCWLHPVREGMAEFMGSGTMWLRTRKQRKKARDCVVTLESQPALAHFLQVCPIFTNS